MAANSDAVTLSNQELLEAISALLKPVCDGMEHQDLKLHDLEARLTAIAALLDELEPHARKAIRLLTANPAAKWRQRHGGTPVQ